MTGKDMFLGMNYVSTRFVEEAETVTQLKGEKKRLSLGRPVLIAAMISLLLLLVGCGAVIYSMIVMRVEDVQTHTPDGETQVGEEIHFEETDDVFIELGAYYPQQIPEGYSMTFVSEGAPLQRQRIVYENSEGKSMDYLIMIGDPSSSIEIYEITNKTDVEINGNPGILYEQAGDNRQLVWIDEAQGYGFALITDDATVDLIAIAKSTAPGEPLVTTRSESTVKALEELGDLSPGYLPEGYVEQGVLGSPLEEGGGWYSYVNKYYVNKAENTRIFFEYQTYAIATEDGYEDNAKTACSFFIPGCNILDDVMVGEEMKIGGMFALVTENNIAWADPETHVVYHLNSEDVLGEELLKIAQSIYSNE